jgi:AcrR family transcriptional regulator
MAAPRQGTRERILNAAEKLFATRGVEGTSTRAIVAASGDTIGSVNYHFGSKEKLFHEVVRRRFDVIADDRRARYRDAAVRAGAKGPSLEDVVDSIVIPYVERALRGGKGWASYTHLIGLLLFSPKLYHKAVDGFGDNTAMEFMNWLSQALPDADSGDIAYAYEFMIGCMIEICMESMVDRVSTFTNGRWSAKNFDTLTPRLVAFITAGIAAVVAPKTDQKKR